MMNKVEKLIEKKDYIVPSLLILNYKKINLTAEELVFIIYVINNGEDFNPKKISQDLDLNLDKIMDLINNLTNKGLINLEIKKINNVRSEYFNIEKIYKKLAFLLVDEEEKKDNNIFDIFEKEFGRTLSPMEYEIINTWLDNFKENTIILALKEATYNGVSNLRYIDKILYEWQKKGIKTEEDIINNKKNFVSKKENKETFDYDWLNDE
jgi:DNA replication protein